MVSTMVSKTTSLSSSLSTPANLYYMGATIISWRKLMNSSFFISFKRFFIFLLILYTFLVILFVPIINNYPYINLIFPSNQNMVWPIPSSTAITSEFGYRNAPTSGSSTYHSGIDIGANEGSNLIACFSGSITFTGFSGAGGYSIILENDTFKASYCHCSPNYVVHEGMYVIAGEVIGNVGPKIVYDVPNNPYRDSNGNPTNGATTGCHLHFSLKLKSENTFVNPLNYVPY